MKSYGQRCAVARALDVIGERWTPLIVRELLLGPRRYTDLLEALPGVGTNILARRLADLRANGVVTKRMLPPPTPVAVYELTEAGEALGPVLAQLRSWGERFGTAPRPDDAIRPAWILQTAASHSSDFPPGRLCTLRVGAEAFALIGDEQEVKVKARSTDSPDAAITIDPPVLLRLAGGRIDAARARDEVEIEGDPQLARQVLNMLAGAAM